MNLNDLFQSRDSFASRLIHYKARKLARHPAFSRSDRPDIEQELLLEIVRKHRCYDPERSSEKTFVVRVIDNKIISLIRVALAEKRDYRRNENSLNERIPDPEGGWVERAQTLEASTARGHIGRANRSEEDRSQLRLDIDELLDSLPEDLRQLAELLREKSEYASSRALGKSRRQTAKGVSRLRRLFEDSNLRDYL